MDPAQHARHVLGERRWARGLWAPHASRCAPLRTALVALQLPDHSVAAPCVQVTSQVPGECEAGMHAGMLAHVVGRLAASASAAAGMSWALNAVHSQTSER